MAGQLALSLAFPHTETQENSGEEMWSSLCLVLPLYPLAVLGLAVLVMMACRVIS